MARSRRSFVCRDCGAESPAWAGRCARCGEWATIDEVDANVAKVARATPPDVTQLSSLDGDATVPTPTGLDEVDRVLGGGLTAGSVTLIGGEPGVGKSTLTLQLALAVAAGGASAVIVAGEEAPAQIAARAHRLGAVPTELSVIDDTTVDGVIATLEEVRPLVAVIDSIQTVRCDDVDGSPGSISQLKTSTERLAAAAKRLDVSIVMIGHVTKEGALAGPRVIEHLVDTVLSFGGDRAGELRYLRAVKHRFGPTSEVGLFEMTGAGLGAVADASGRFLTDRRPGLPGSAIVPTLEGRRPVLVEIQALTFDGPTVGQQTVQGVDGRRLAMVSAVLSRRVGFRIAGQSAFVSATGGASVTEPGADLGLALALVSSVTDLPLPDDMVACGEVGLGGELRSVPQLTLRLQEAYRLGFRSAIVPASGPAGPAGMVVVRASTLEEAIQASAQRTAAIDGSSEP